MPDRIKRLCLVQCQKKSRNFVLIASINSVNNVNQTLLNIPSFSETLLGPAQDPIGDQLQSLINPLVPRRHICAAYIDKFAENLVLKISQFCFLGIFGAKPAKKLKKVKSFCGTCKSRFFE
jgi:hypothetical protein